MFKYPKAITLFLLICLPFFAAAQKGTIRGQVIDGENGEPLFSANVVIKGTQIGTTTDFDGKFELQSAPGNVVLDISFIGMSSTVVSEVAVKAGEVTVVDAVALQPATNELDAVTITAESVRNTEAAMITVKRKSANVMDGISSAALRKTGDSDAGSAVKRVTGVSVEGGKYVFVRGLGDRYTKTLLNGVDIPGLDPDRNSLQIDIFPTNLISNMTVLKSGLAELPADFAGGLVNIETKEFPEKRILDVSLGFSFNPSMHFNSNFLDYQGSNTDFLGFDGGARTNPDREGIAPNIPDTAAIASFTDDFSRTLGAEEQTSFMDYSAGISMGNQYTLKNDAKLGYIFSATYKRSTVFYDDIAYGEYIRPTADDEYDLIFTTTQNGALGQRNTLLGGMTGLAYKSLKSKYKLTLMHLQNGENRAAQLNIRNSDDATGQSGYRAFSNNLEYNQRSLSNVLLSGEHFLEGGEWQIEWKLSPTFSRLRDPDIRKTAFTIEQGDSSFEPGQGGNPTRIWRYLDEVNAVAQVNVLREHDLFGDEAKLKFGLNHVFKQRMYSIVQYDLVDGGATINYSGDPNQVLTDERVFPEGPLRYTSNRRAGLANPNAYSSNVQHFSAYLSEEFKLKDLKAILGLRTELFQQRHTGRDQAAAVNPDQGNSLDNELVLNNLQLFPSANLIYALTEDMNLRASYFRSIARPSFKELSFAQILDPVSNRTFNGGLFRYQNWEGNLTSTLINNFDLRWELFMQPGEILSVSAFYKQFNDPIELVRIFASQTTNDFQPRNVGDGEVYGLELEVRKNLAFISPNLERFNFSGNYTYVRSFIDMTSIEYEARQLYEKEGEQVDSRRQMQGQAPFVVNAGLNYEDKEKALTVGMYYNLKGPTLTVVGGGIFPDVYSEPFHALNFSLSKSFGEEDKNTLSLQVSNILNDVREQFFTGYQAADEVFTRFSPGTAFSVSYGYSF